VCPPSDQGFVTAGERVVWEALRDQLADDDVLLKQAEESMYALRACVSRAPRWGSGTPVRWGHAVLLPYTPVEDDFALVDAQRWRVAAPRAAARPGSRSSRHACSAAPANGGR